MNKTLDTLVREGFTHLTQAIAPTDLVTWAKAAHALSETVGLEYFDSGWRIENVVCKHRDLASLVDSPQHLEIPYVLYEKQLKLLSSRLFVRTPHQSSFSINPWHRDGPRHLPFRRFQSPERPLRIKIALWLTDVNEDADGPLSVLPRSHLWEHIPEIGTHKSRPDEVRIYAKKGDITFMHSDIFHRVLNKTTKEPRVNFFLEYGPSWLVSTDRVNLSREQTHFMTDRQRAILGDWLHPNHAIKPPEHQLALIGGDM